MATKLNGRKSGSRRGPDGKRVRFVGGQAKTSDRGRPLKTSDVQKE